LVLCVFAAPVWAVPLIPNTLWWGSFPIASGNYTINTPEELAGLAQLLQNGDDQFADDTFTLAGTIDFSGYDDGLLPIGDSNHPFLGKFYGENDSKITNLTIISTGISPIGLFGSIGSGAEVKNLTLVNVNIDMPSKNMVGGIAGSNSGTIENCTVSGTIIGKDNVGGIVGYNNTSTPIATVTNCTISGTITGEDNVGGIVGCNDSTATIEDCKVAANSKIIGDSFVSTGALVGDNNSDHVEDNWVSYTVKVKNQNVTSDNLVGSASSTKPAPGDNSITKTPPPGDPDAAGGGMGCDAGFGVAGIGAFAGAALVYRRKRR
jgi:hypothetical protein